MTYRPTDNGRGKSLMTDLAALQPGGKYRVARVVQGLYVVLDGFESSPTGGLFWTEFESAV